MPIYERGSGGHIAERVSPVPGSEEAERYEALAADPTSDWRRAEPDQRAEPKRRTKPTGGAS